ncbi:poly-gamma-glutamate synthase PgsB [Leptospira sp. 201903070]|uniref:Poly-gamma-glutamate synthase PgsB n=1 Tax=Leptospira ainlahdjerensis TaxID=2810033 RepID=A0ABS2UDG4_9LEPT|nr:poly-gamma-glutamate synthase PgsB [Leptospira ainlahdjerensis]MBM9578412.1 poly-gamma-glutamate synthase PgsB [Leptospira ainlahdjerensis]
MFFSISILSVSFLLFVVFLFLEKKKHSDSLARIPIRIHVNGTRGKSSVTRLIHSILVEAGWNVFAKTTGSAASLLFPDRSEKRIFRNKVSISEQITFLNFIAKNKPRAVVVECMAVQPQYQKDSESILLNATHTVITNIRPDHGEYSNSKEEIRNGFLLTIPKNGILLYGRSLENLDWTTPAKQKNTDAILGVPKISEEYIQKIASSLRYPEHIENIEIAVALCENLGLKKNEILKGIFKTNPDPGALEIREFSFRESKQIFVFAFAANDTISWEKILLSVERETSSVRVNVVFTSKKERPVRTKEFASYLSKISNLDTIYFFGTGYRLFTSIYTGNARVLSVKKTDSIQWDSNIQNSNIWIGAGNFEGEGRVWLRNQILSLEKMREKEWKS